MEGQGKDESDEFVFVGGSMTGTIHAGEWTFAPYLFIDVPGNIPTIKTVRRTIAEFQLNAFVRWSALRNKKHELQLRAGILGRL